MKVEIIMATPSMVPAISEAAAVCYDGDINSTKRVGGIVKAGHLACLRFAHATIRITEISRACAFQLIRHAHLDYFDPESLNGSDFMMRSQRYVKENDKLFVTPPAFIKHPEDIALYGEFMARAWEVYGILLQRGHKAEDARYVLPNACETSLNMVGNMQAWQDFLYGKAGRLQKAAQWEIKEVAQEVEKLLTPYLPLVFGSERYIKKG